MTDENGIIKCIEFEYNTKCLEGTISTNYYNDIYKCTKCEKNFILSYDDYYDTYICKDIFIDYINPSIYDISFYESDNGIPTINGKCSDGYFTRNLNVCIKCDDETNGMPGCKGKCNFRINRKKKLKCEKDNLIPDENGGCKGQEKCIIGKHYCNGCDKNSKLCEKFEEGDLPDKNGGYSYTDNCEFSYNGECLKYISDFIITGSNYGLKICKSIYSDDFNFCEKINYENGQCEKC